MTMGLEGIELELFRHRLAAVAEEMGEVLTLAGFSPNIKERRDHSCAIFDGCGDMVAQAAHIPVHLGAAPLCVKAVIAALDLEAGETAIVNDPFHGGTHLPDITLVSAVALPGVAERWYVATRAHHADVGGITPGSLPPSRHIDEEGWRCPPRRLDEEVVAELLAVSRTPQERRGDLAAQRAANAVGARRLVALAERFGGARLVEMGEALQVYSARRCMALLETWPRRAVEVEDALDDALGDGVPVALRLRLAPEGEGWCFDFRGCADQVAGPMNAVRAIVESAVFYTLLCLGEGDWPANGGVMRPVRILTRPGSVVDARWPAAVAAGNVETSQRLVDLCVRALEALQPGRMPAAASGSMNNVLIGSLPGDAAPFVYYETVGGGYGGSPARAGASAVQVHMTNTLNTPAEALEHAYPLRLVACRVREGSGGAGQHAGGEGIERVWEFLRPAQLTVIAERRRIAPPGAAGGGDGAVGEQWLERTDGRREVLGGKVSVEVGAGDRFVLRTPGGGGWGALPAAG